MEILCFFAGMAFFYQKSIYPLYLLGASLFFRPKTAFVIWFLAAILWSLFHQWMIADQGMPGVSLIKNAHLQGYIDSIPNQNPNKTQFQLLATQLNGHAVKATILLSCYSDCPKLHVGQTWQLIAKIKKPLNLRNPGGFDYEALMHARHLFWVGYVRPHSFKEMAGPSQPLYVLTKLREYLASLLAALIPDASILGIVEALTLGITTHIDKHQWDLFRRTGTTHLIDISGEHIALVAGLSYGILKKLWKNTGSVCLHYPAQKMASLGAIITTIAYTLIAGFAVPTQRSLITCCLVLFQHFSHQRMSIWQSWRYALLAVLLLEPHAVFMIGFYFSFIAVAILILINQRFKCYGLPKMLLLQCACMIGLMPLSLYWFSYGSINGLAANLIAIPWVGFIIVPLALIITFLSPWIVIPGSVYLLKSAITGFLFCLNIIDSFTFFNINFSFTEASSPLAMMLAITLMLFLPLLHLLPATALVIITSLFPQHEIVPLGEARINVLDVGQGLAVVIRTAHHVLMYDTGMKFYRSNDMGALAIIPYLNTLNINRLDKIVISHFDLDHRGGLHTLQEKYSRAELVVDKPALYGQGVSCHEYPAWDWDGVHFQFFPITQAFKGKNNNSCVLHIKNNKNSMLLSGDIEKPAEAYLVKTYGEKLASTYMLVPHHGSKTSSSTTYVSQIAPHYAIASYGFDNRYHFPHTKTLNTYQQHHIPLYNTKDCGMISIHLGTHEPTAPHCFEKSSHLFFKR